MPNAANIPVVITIPKKNNTITLEYTISGGKFGLKGVSGTVANLSELKSDVVKTKEITFR